MPEYNRVTGANVPDITGVRLVQTDWIESMPDRNPLEINTGTTHILLKAGADAGSITHTFRQLNGTGRFEYSQRLTEAGIMYTYKINFEHAKNRPEMGDFLQKAQLKQFVAVVLDSNMNFMLLGRKDQPFLLTVDMNASPSTYQIEAICESNLPPIFITSWVGAILFGATHSMFI